MASTKGIRSRSGMTWPSETINGSLPMACSARMPPRAGRSNGRVSTAIGRNSSSRASTRYRRTQ